MAKKLKDAKAAKAAKAADSVKLSQSERWQTALAAAKCLPPRVSDANGLTNKDHLYRAFRLALAAGITLTVDELLASCGNAISRSKMSSWRRRWLKIADGTMSPDTSVPKASHSFEPPKSKASATRKLSESKRAYTVACKPTK